MADVTEWQKEIYFSGELSLQTPRIVPPFFPLPLSKPEDPVLAGMGERLREIQLMIVTCIIVYLNSVLRNWNRSFKHKLEKSAFRGSCWGIKTQVCVLMFSESQ